MRNTSSAPDEFRMVTALVIIAAFMPTILMVAPAIAAQLAQEYQLGPAQIGSVISSELAGMSLATLPAWYWLNRFSWSNLVRIWIAVFVLCNVISGWMSSAESLMIMRFASGVAGGSLMIICLSAASHTQNPDRVYGLWVLGQLVVGAIGLAFLPGLFESYGLKVGYWILAAIVLCCLPLSHRFVTNNQQKEEASRQKLGTLALAGLAAVLLFYVSLNGVWTFSGMFAERLSLSAERTGDILAIATFFGIAGALCASWVGDRWGRFLPLFTGFGMMIAGTYLLRQQSELIYSNATFLFKFAWTLALPFILATLARIDHQGQLMNSTNLVIGGGLAIGPLIFGHMLEAGVAIDQLIIVACITALISFLLLVFVQNATHSSSQPIKGAQHEQ
ncbi:putative Permease of the major facilitator superfamily [Vibrio nigripulchritudo SO65]|uniref:MFS transporter n=1 Tax=Vibrio nigripulchritudo TaxID=28173 RepID=UPI0003B2381B|nr:MFS transporter [Vibrio nigripulchritudo]CCN34810.1 putative Permease of the major facilitator superfamily [Vibrio nigripulchritudo AM115]CCN43131.1 putative Permease of the major facilitator superfamily [Vibrio nigripulchritudo FTn2]CCN67907.1 putative Permease of the major facilitator superfamily [Vibrio nigripulchritudo POn4]CCN74834.1 putative Permease of the major facilitator superfamily [Vibrio nigripulchritudo SO65]